QPSALLRGRQDRPRAARGLRAPPGGHAGGGAALARAESRLRALKHLDPEPAEPGLSPPVQEDDMPLAQPPEVREVAAAAARDALAHLIAREVAAEHLAIVDPVLREIGRAHV